MRAIKFLPLLIISVAIYNFLAFQNPMALDQSVYSLTLMSGAVLTVTMSEALIMGSLVLLYVEVLKATSSSDASLVDHALSMAVFVLCLVEFLVVPACGTSVFFILLLMTGVDVIAGFSVTIKTARRDWGHS